MALGVERIPAARTSVRILWSYGMTRPLRRSVLLLRLLTYKAVGVTAGTRDAAS